MSFMVRRSGGTAEGPCKHAIWACSQAAMQAMTLGVALGPASWAVVAAPAGAIAATHIMMAP